MGKMYFLKQFHWQLSINGTQNPSGINLNSTYEIEGQTIFIFEKLPLLASNIHSPNAIITALHGPFQLNKFTQLKLKMLAMYLVFMMTFL